MLTSMSVSLCVCVCVCVCVRARVCVCALVCVYVSARLFLHPKLHLAYYIIFQFEGHLSGTLAKALSLLSFTKWKGPPLCMYYKPSTSKVHHSNLLSLTSQHFLSTLTILLPINSKTFNFHLITFFTFWVVYVHLLTYVKMIYCIMPFTLSNVVDFDKLIEDTYILLFQHNVISFFNIR